MFIYILNIVILFNATEVITLEHGCYISALEHVRQLCSSRVYKHNF